MEQLRLEYLAREERFMLDGDRNELRTIKQELDELRSVHNDVDSFIGVGGICHWAALYVEAGHGRIGNQRSVAESPSCSENRPLPPLGTSAIYGK